MKSLRWPTNKEKQDYMRGRKKENCVLAEKNPCENQVWSRLQKTRYSWSRQAMWGYRIFDFWCHQIGVAIEVDGRTHDAEYDAYRDEYNFRRSTIVVLRMKNGDMQRLEYIIRMLPKLGTKSKRRKELGLRNNTNPKRKKLAEQPYPPSLLKEYLLALIDGKGVGHTKE